MTGSVSRISEVRTRRGDVAATNCVSGLYIYNIEPEYDGCCIAVR